MLAFTAVLTVAGVYVLTARQVELIFEPGAQRMTLRGPQPRFRIGERYLLRPGTYDVEADREGYRPLRESFVVGAGQPTMVELAFEELPGIVAVRCVGGDDAGTPVQGASVDVDGVARGPAPAEELELERGEHALRVTADRYRPLEQTFVVEGFGRRQTVEVELRPNWADVEIATSPVSGELWVDGAAVERTPCRIELLAGAHELEIRAEGFETWRRELEVVAEEPVSLLEIVLAPAKGILRVETEPSGAQVMIAGEYVGTSPVEWTAAPEEDLLVQVARAGYEPVERRVRLESGVTRTERFELTAELGTVVFEVSPGEAELLINGEPVGEVPAQLTLPAEQHRFEIRKEGYTSESRTLTPIPGLPQRLTVDLVPIAPEPTGPAPRVTAANGYELVLVGPGAFTMGASRREQGRRSNETLRSIKLERPFYMGVREVTNEEFRGFLAEHDSGFVDDVSLNGKDRPAVQVGWDAAARYCNWLSARDGLEAAYVEVQGALRAVSPPNAGYRLPTEAEWEFAARIDGTNPPLKYPWGTELPPRGKAGNFADESASDLLNTRLPEYEDGYAGPAPVASFPPNALGLHDLGGNVSEWCHDFYSIYSYDPGKVETDPTGPESGRHHVVRGSSWRDASITALRFSYRDYSEEARDDLGFRICRYLTEAEDTR